MTKDAAFWDRFAPRYARMALRNPEAYEQTLAEVRAHLSPQDHVLEHGCGTGSTALRLAGDVADYIAADFSQGMIDIAEAKRRAAGTQNLTFLTAGIDDPRFRESPRDVVLAFSLLHLLPDLDAALAAIRTQVKPGGLFISKTICVADMPVWVPPILAVMRVLGRAPRLHRHSGAQIEAAIARAGFDIVTSRIFGDVRYARFIVARRKV